MARELDRVGQYRLLHYQPEPETGERITIGLLFEGEGNVRLHYDKKFSKLRKLYPWIDSDSIGFYLDNLRAALEKTTSIDAVLNLYGPQLVSSPARKVTLPVTDTIVSILEKKFVLPAAHGPHAAKAPDQVAMAIRNYVENRVHKSLRILTEVTAETVLGKKSAGVGVVALAVQSSEGWTLIDGVDLNVLKPKKAIERADDVCRTFWNYARLTKEGHAKSIRKIGIVLNGNSHRKQRDHDAHDYALHRLQAEADRAIDTASGEATANLEKELQELQ